MYIREVSVEVNERHIAGERILQAIEDLTENGFEVSVSTAATSDGEVGWAAAAEDSERVLSCFALSIEGALVELRDNFMGGPKEIEK